VVIYSERKIRNIFRLICINNNIPVANYRLINPRYQLLTGGRARAPIEAHRTDPALNAR